MSTKLPSVQSNPTRSPEFPNATCASPRSPSVFLDRDDAVAIYQSMTGIARKRLDSSMQRWFRDAGIAQGWTLILFPNVSGNRTNKAGVLLAVIP